MKLSKQVCSLELAKKLKELGFEQESLFYHSLILDEICFKDPATGNYYGTLGGIYDNEVAKQPFVSAYTVAELGEMLPADLHCLSYFTIKEKWIDEVGGKHRDYFFNYNGIYDENMANGECVVQKTLIGSQSKTEANARAKMLIYLKENGFIK